MRELLLLSASVVLVAACGGEPQEPRTADNPTIQRSPLATEDVGGCATDLDAQQLLAAVSMPTTPPCVSRYLAANPEKASDLVLDLRIASPEAADAGLVALRHARLAPTTHPNEYLAVAEMYSIQRNWGRVLELLVPMPLIDVEVALRAARLVGEALLHSDRSSEGLTLLRRVVEADPVATEAAALVAQFTRHQEEAAAYCMDLLDAGRALQARACARELQPTDARQEVELRLRLLEGADAGGLHPETGAFASLAARCESGRPLMVRWYSTDAVRDLLGSRSPSPATFLAASQTQTGPASACYLSLAAAACLVQLSAGEHCAPTNVLSQYVDTLRGPELTAFARGVFSAKNSFYYAAPGSDELVFLHLSLAQGFAGRKSKRPRYVDPTYHLERAEKIWKTVRKSPFPAWIGDQLLADIAVVLPEKACDFAGSVGTGDEREEIKATGTFAFRLPVGSQPVSIQGRATCPDFDCKVTQKRRLEVRHGIVVHVSMDAPGECNVTFSQRAPEPR